MNNLVWTESDSLHDYIVKVKEIPLLTREEEMELARRWWNEKDMEAARRLVLANLRFVVKIAMEYRNYGMDLKDLIQEGNIGLMLGVKKFNPYKGYRLISYVVWWIRAYIHNHILKSWSIVKMGTTQAQRKLFYKLKKAKSNLLMNRDVDDREVMSHLEETLNVSAGEISEFEKRMNGRDIYLETSPFQEGTRSLKDFVRVQEKPQIDRIAEKERKIVLKREMARAFKVLNPREMEIIRNRYFLEKPKTLQEIGKEFNISRERVRQIEERAREKMKVVLSENRELLLN